MIHIGSDYKIAHNLKTSFPDAMLRRVIAWCKADPEPLNRLLLLDNCLQQMRIDAPSTPCRKRQEVPQINGMICDGEGKVQFCDTSSLRRHPSIGSRLLIYNCNVDMISSLKTSCNDLF